MAKSILQISLFTEFQFTIYLVEVCRNIHGMKYPVLNIVCLVIAEYLAFKSEKVSLRQTFWGKVLILLLPYCQLHWIFLRKPVYRIYPKFQHKFLLNISHTHKVWFDSVQLFSHTNSWGGSSATPLHNWLHHQKFKLIQCCIHVLNLTLNNFQINCFLFVFLYFAQTGP